MSLTLVHGRVRQEELLLMEAAKREGLEVQAVHDDGLILDEAIPGDGVLIRSISASRALMIARHADALGQSVINGPATIGCCMDKADTSLQLRRHGVATPKTILAFTPESAQEAAKQLGFPVVLKPVQGSWGRMVHKVRDAEELRQNVEARQSIPGSMNHVFYLQEYINKGTESFRDIRSFVVGDEVIGAIYREGDHWLTNTALGAKTSNCPVTDELRDISLKATDAVGGGIVAVDLMEDNGYTVHEVNHSMEFRNSISATGVDIPLKILEYAIREAKQ